MGEEDIRQFTSYLAVQAKIWTMPPARCARRKQIKRDPGVALAHTSVGAPLGAPGKRAYPRVTVCNAFSVKNADDVSLARRRLKGTLRWFELHRPAQAQPRRSSRRASI